MRKRDFLRSLGLGALGLTAGRWAQGGGEKSSLRRRPPKNWIWITTEAVRPREEWKRTLGEIRAAGIDAIVPEVYDGRHAYFESSRLPVEEDRLGMFLELARKEAIEVHPWMWTMPCLVDDILKKHPDWYNVNAKGESAATKPAYVDYYKFLDPANPEVREWIRGTVRELSDIPLVSSVHLDYVRHPDAILPRGLWARYNLVQDRVHPEFDYGYTEYSRKKFKSKHGIDPMKIKDPTGHKEWMQYRLDSITDLVNDYLVPAAHERGRMVTAAVFPGPTLAREMVRQDWGRWKLDAFLPMLYSHFYQAGPEWVREQTAEGVATVKVPVYSGLYTPQTDAASLAAQIEAALDGGAAGVSLFSLSSMDAEKWKALADSVRADTSRS